MTGADGVLGSNVVRELLSREHTVSVLLLRGNVSPTLSGLNLIRHYGDILHPDILDEAVRDQDCVIHCAASTNVYPARNEHVNRVNIEGSKNVVEACIKHNVGRLVYVGTANSFGSGSDTHNPGKEGNPYTAVKYGLDYMDSKRIAQEYIIEQVRTNGLPAIVVNPTFMIGPYDSKPSSGALILGLYKRRVPGYTLGGKNYIAVKDAAVAIANALQMGRVGECYILGNENLSYKEAFERISGVIGVKPPRMKLSNRLIKIYGRLNSSLAAFLNYPPTLTKELAYISTEIHYYSAQKAIEELHLPQTPLEIAVQECFEWFKENGYLSR